MDTFTRWLEETAASRGIDEEDLLSEVLSSYWAMNELDAGGSDARDRRSPVGDLDRGPEPTPEDRRLGEFDPGEDAPGADGPGLERDLADIKQGIGTLQRSVEEIAELRDVLEGLERQLGERRRDGDPDDEGTPDETAEDLEAVAADLAELRAAQERYIGDVADDLQLIGGRLQQLEATVEDAAGPDEEAVTALRERVTDVEADLAGLREDQRAADERVEREFDDIEGLFEHLIERLDDAEERIDDLDERVDEWVETYRADMDRVERRADDADRLGELLRAGTAAGVTAGDCEACGERIDLPMLVEPRCPGCDRELTGVRSGGWNPLRGPTVETGPPAVDADDRGPTDDG